MVSTETTFQILKKLSSLQFILNVHGLSYINYLNIPTTVWRKILTVENFDESGLGKF